MKILFWFSDLGEVSKIFSELSKWENAITEIVSSAQDFQAKFNRFKPDVVFIDLDGENKNFANQFNNLIKERFPKVKRFLLISKLDVHEIRKSQMNKYTANGYIPKPLAKEFLDLFIPDLINYQQVNSAAPASAPESESSPE